MKRSLFVLLVLMLGFSVLAQNSDSDGGAPDKEQAMLAAGWPPYGPDSIAASTLVATGLVQNGTAVDLTMLATNASGDLEYLDRITVEFPVGWTITAVGFDDLYGALYSTPVTGGVGTNVATWTNASGLCSGLGFQYGGGAPLQLMVSVDTGVQLAGTIPIPWMMEGDTWGSDPSVLCSTGSSCNYDVCYAAVAPPQPAPGVDMLLNFEVMVPTLGTWGLGAFVLLLGLVAVIFARKKLA